MPRLPKRHNVDSLKSLLAEHHKLCARLFAQAEERRQACAEDVRIVERIDFLVRQIEKDFEVFRFNNVLDILHKHNKVITVDRTRRCTDGYLARSQNRDEMVDSYYFMNDTVTKLAIKMLEQHIVSVLSRLHDLTFVDSSCNWDDTLAWKKLRVDVFAELDAMRAEPSGRLDFVFGSAY